MVLSAFLLEDRSSKRILQVLLYKVLEFRLLLLIELSFCKYFPEEVFKGKIVVRFLLKVVNNFKEINSFW